MTTIFVGHTPGTYKAYLAIGGWGVMFLDKDGNTRNADGGKIHKHRQNAYRRVDRLNHPIKHAIKKTGICEALWDRYTLVVRENENEDMQDVVTLYVKVGDMPPHSEQNFKTVEEIENYLRDESQFPLYLDWCKVETEDE